MSATALTWRRPVTVHRANGPHAALCGDCGARHSGLCDALTDEDLAFLARMAQPMTVAAGQLLIEEGAPAGHFYNINHGHMRLFKALPDGRRQITGFAAAGHFLGLASDHVYAISAEAMDDVTVCRFARAQLHTAFETFPALERKLLEVAMHELSFAQEQFLLLGRKTARERVTSFLLNWAAREADCATAPAPGTRLRLLPTRTDVADYLGLTIETVSRTLTALKRDGLIDLPDQHEIVLRHPAALKEIAQAV